MLNGTATFLSVLNTLQSFSSASTRLSAVWSVRPSSRYLERLPRYFGTMESGVVDRQGRQIVQSWLDLDDSSP